MDNIMNKLRNLDADPKINKDFYSCPLSGGIITLASSFVMILLFISELRETLRINFNVTFLALSCSIPSLDAMDISGEQHLDVRHDIIKKRLDAHGNVIESRQDGIGAPKIDKPLQRHGGRLEHNETYCGSCNGAETVAGNFHFAPGKSFHQSGVHVHDLLAFQNDSFNISYKINRLTFGDYFPGVVNPLDGVQWTHETPIEMYQYFIKVVPIVYSDVSGHTIQSNQFSLTEHFRSSELGHFQSLPGVFFFYDLSPIKVTFTEGHISFLHFLTNVCAIIVGGVFTISEILDSFIYHGQRAIKKKMEIGKFS